MTSMKPFFIKVDVMDLNLYGGQPYSYVGASMTAYQQLEHGVLPLNGLLLFFSRECGPMGRSGSATPSDTTCTLGKEKT